MNRQVDASHYDFATYVTPARFASYWHQVNEVISLKPRTVLEVGPGPGIVTHILREQRIKVTTCDIVDDTRPALRASALHLPFRSDSFDVVLCCQVLEHIPFESSIAALAEFRRVCSTACVISLPHAGRYWAYTLHVPKLGTVRFGLQPQLLAPAHRFDGQHYWEIGKRGYSARAVRRRYKALFQTVRSFRVHDNHYHQFFVLVK